tara:strand:+ start:318 stop:977 length:660 start_codon:yes stop_codon:yes gene_type:complete
MKNFNYVKQKNFFTKSYTQSILKKFNHIFKNSSYKKINLNTFELKIDEILDDPLLLEVFNKVHEQIEIITNLKNLKLNKLWLVYSVPDAIKKTNVPYIPHFDKQRYMKAMLYLNPVSIKNGPIHLGEVKNSINIEEKRLKLPEDYKLKKLNIISNKQLKKELKPMLGNSGDIIFFDTNSPHKAGLIEKGYYRKVMRFDFELNKKSKNKFFLKKLFNFIK